MTNRQAQAAQRLITRMKGRAAETVLYRRGGTSAGGLSAVLGSSVHEGSDDFGNVVKTNSKDFVFELADLVPVVGATGRPERGDEIEWAGNVYAVLPFGDDYVWAWADPLEISIAVHTKEAGTV